MDEKAATVLLMRKVDTGRAKRLPECLTALKHSEDGYHKATSTWMWKVMLDDVIIYCGH